MFFFLYHAFAVVSSNKWYESVFCWKGWRIYEEWGWMDPLKRMESWAKFFKKSFISRAEPIFDGVLFPVQAGRSIYRAQLLPQLMYCIQNGDAGRSWKRFPQGHTYTGLRAFLRDVRELITFDLTKSEQIYLWRPWWQSTLSHANNKRTVNWDSQFFTHSIP